MTITRFHFSQLRAVTDVYFAAKGTIQLPKQVLR